MKRMSQETLHGRIANFIRTKIFAKEWSPGQRIPSEHGLMEMFQVSRGTVRKAVQTLVDEGLLVQEHGRGTFVRPPSIAHPGGDRPLSFAESLRQQGIAFRTSVLSMERIGATQEVALHLTIDEGDPVLRLRRLRVADRPIMVLDSWIPLNVCPGVERMPLETMSLFDAVELVTGRHIVQSQLVYSARAAAADLAQLLEVPEGSPILNLEQLICLDDGRPIEWGDTMLAAGQTVVGTAQQRPAQQGALGSRRIKGRSI